MTASRDSAAPPWSIRLLSELDASDARAQALVGDLTPTQLNWTPAGGGWSVGQCLDHLCVANDVYIPAIDASLEAAPTGVVHEITPGWFGRWFIRNHIEPSATMKRGRAPRKIVPASRVEPSVLERFIRGNLRARTLVLRAAKHDVNRLRFKNPFVRGIRFTAGTGLEILLKHQRRHLLQGERVRQRAEFPK